MLLSLFYHDVFFKSAIPRDLRLVTAVVVVGLLIMGAAVSSAVATTGVAATVIPTATSASDVYAAQATAATSHQTSNVQGAVFDRFVTIWLENTDYSKASSDPNLAWLADKGITLSNYFGVTHPSEPNYVASIGGDYFGIDNDNFNRVDKYVSSVVDLLEDKGISWAAYQEDMPYSGYQGMAWVNQNTKANDYVRKHNPPVNYDANTTPDRLATQKNLTEFYIDLDQDTLPQWLFLTPNMTADGHDSSVTVAGQWTRNFLEPLLNNASSTFWKRTMVLITFDENHTYTSGNRVYSILLGDAIPSSLIGTTDDQFYNHYSEISTVEANWDLHTLGRWDVGANVFDLVASQTGDFYRPYDAVTSSSSETVFLNSSTAGPFSTGKSPKPYSAPNICLKSCTGRTVLPAIVEQWQDTTTETVYTDTAQIPDGDHPSSVVSISC